MLREAYYNNKTRDVRDTGVTRTLYGTVVTKAYHFRAVPKMGIRNSPGKAFYRNIRFFRLLWWFQVSSRHSKTCWSKRISPRTKWQLTEFHCFTEKLLTYKRSWNEWTMLSNTYKNKRSLSLNAQSILIFW